MHSKAGSGQRAQAGQGGHLSALPAPAPAAADPAWSLPETLFMPGIPLGIFKGNVLGDNAETGEPTDEALIPPFIVESYFTSVGNLVLDERLRVSTGFNASGSGGRGAVSKPSRTYLPKLDARIKLNIKIKKR